MEWIILNVKITICSSLQNKLLENDWEDLGTFLKSQFIFLFFLTQRESKATLFSFILRTV